MSSCDAASRAIPRMRLTPRRAVLYHARPAWESRSAAPSTTFSAVVRLSLPANDTRAYDGVEPESPTERLARQQRGLLLSFAGMGLELAGGIIGFVLIGYLIDWKFGTGPAWLVTGATLGCVGGLYNTIRRAIQMQRRMEALTKRNADRSAPSDESDSHET